MHMVDSTWLAYLHTVRGSQACLHARAQRSLHFMQVGGDVMVRMVVVQGRCVRAGRVLGR